MTENTAVHSVGGQRINHVFFPRGGMYTANRNARPAVHTCNVFFRHFVTLNSLATPKSRSRELVLGSSWCFRTNHVRTRLPPHLFQTSIFLSATNTCRG